MTSLVGVNLQISGTSPLLLTFHTCNNDELLMLSPSNLIYIRSTCSTYPTCFFHNFFILLRPSNRIVPVRSPPETLPANAFSRVVFPAPEPPITASYSVYQCGSHLTRHPVNHYKACIRWRKPNCADPALVIFGCTLWFMYSRMKQCVSMICYTLSLPFLTCI